MRGYAVHYAAWISECLSMLQQSKTRQHQQKHIENKVTTLDLQIGFEEGSVQHLIYPKEIGNRMQSFVLGSMTRLPYLQANLDPKKIKKCQQIINNIKPNVENIT